MIPTSSIDISNYKVSPLSMIFLLDGNNILTLRRKGNKEIYPNKISGFGGKVEPGEDLITSAHREFTEETGLTVHELSLRGTFIRILDTGYVNEMYIFIAHGFEGKLKNNNHEGEAQWLEKEEFLHSPDIVDHIPLYLEQVIEGKDFYCGIGIYKENKMVQYIDNKSHFAARDKNL